MALILKYNLINPAIDKKKPYYDEKTMDVIIKDICENISFYGNEHAIVAVKVNKNGILSSLLAHELTTGTYTYLQAYTTLELVFDGNDFIVTLPLVKN